MDASTLRWTIIIIGVIILAVIFLFGSPEKKHKPRASRRKPESPGGRREPTLEPVEEAPDSSSGEQPTGQGELPISEVMPIENTAENKPPRKPAGPPPDKIITLFLLARDNHILGGTDLLEAALKTGMEFGDMNIFHRQEEGSDKPFFSMANATKPGYFDKEQWNTFETTGLALFMTLPGPMLALDAWDMMLATARRMSEVLDAEIHDGERMPFTRQNEARVREEMRDYDRSRARQSLS